jgi:hypothetical protein
MSMKIPCLALSLAAAFGVATSALAADAATSPPQEERKICRASTETGSLVKKRKACLTKAQWKAVDDQHEQEAHKMIQDSTTRPKGE